VGVRAGRNPANRQKPADEHIEKYWQFLVEIEMAIV